MKLNMWTIFEYLKSHGFTPTIDISNGTNSIRHIRIGRLTDTEAESDTVQIIENAEAHDRRLIRSLIVCGVDRILVNDADVLSVYNCVLECFNFYNHWERQLLYALVDHSSLQKILRIAHNIFQRPMFIKSAGSLIYAITEGYDESVHINWKRFLEMAVSRTLDMDSVMGVSMDDAFKVAFLKTYPYLLNSPVYNGTVLHTNIWVEQNRVAEIIVLENGKPFNNGDPHIMHVFQKIVTKYMLQNREIYLSSSKEKSFFTELLNGKAYLYSNFSHIRQELKWADSDELAVACFVDFSKCVTPMLNDLNEHLADSFKNSCFFIYDNLIFGIINITKNSGYENVVNALTKHLYHKQVTGALSYEFKSISNLISYYKQCICILKRSRSKVINGECNLFTAYHTAISHLMDQLQELPEINCYAHPDLCRLRDFDTEHNSDYLQTLFNFLLLGCNYTDTANYMNLHRNTLVYRLGRIREIIHSDLSDIDSRKKLLFSFMLEKSENKD